jgi:hypothetical protein
MMLDISFTQLRSVFASKAFRILQIASRLSHSGGVEGR